MKKYTRTVFTIEPEILELAAAHRQKTGHSMAHIFRQAILEYLRQAGVDIPDEIEPVPARKFPISE